MDTTTYKQWSLEEGQVEDKLLVQAGRHLDDGHAAEESSGQRSETSSGRVKTGRNGDQALTCRGCNNYPDALTAAAGREVREFWPNQKQRQTWRGDKRRLRRENRESAYVRTLACFEPRSALAVVACSGQS